MYDYLRISGRVEQDGIVYEVRDDVLREMFEKAAGAGSIKDRDAIMELIILNLDYLASKMKKYLADRGISLVQPPRPWPKGTNVRLELLSGTPDGIRIRTLDVQTIRDLALILVPLTPVERIVMLSTALHATA